MEDRKEKEEELEAAMDYLGAEDCAPRGRWGSLSSKEGPDERGRTRRKLKNNSKILIFRSTLVILFKPCKSE